MSSGATQCAACGAKFSASRTRCPRCRAPVRIEDPRAAAQRSRQLGRASAVLVAAFVLVVVVLWLRRQDGATEPRPAARPAPVSAARGSDIEPSFIEPAGLSQAAGDEDVNQLLGLYEEQVRQRPSDAEARTRLGRLQLHMGRTKEAIGNLQAASDAAPARWQTRVLLAHAQCSISRWDECIGSLRAARDLAPDEFVIFHNMGVALHRRGSDPAAIEEYQRARSLRAGEPRTLLGLAVSQDRAGRAAEAATSYSEYLRLVPDAAGADKIRARLAALRDRPPG